MYVQLSSTICYITFASLLNISALYLCKFTSGLFILFHWSICLFSYQYYSVLKAVFLVFLICPSSLLLAYVTLGFFHNYLHFQLTIFVITLRIHIYSLDSSFKVVLLGILNRVVSNFLFVSSLSIKFHYIFLDVFCRLIFNVHFLCSKLYFLRLLFWFQFHLSS